MKYSASIFGLAMISLVLFSCNSKKMERLESERTRLQADSLAKDSLLNDWFTTFNDIEDNLAEITGRQKYIMSTTASESPNKPDIRERIRMEIAIINDIIMDNQLRLEKLKKQLKSSNLKIKALEETIAILNKRVEEKNSEISVLKEELARLNIEKENLNKTVAQLKKETAKQMSMLQQKEETIDQQNAVWYVAGTSKYLIENGIIEKTGLLGSSKKLSDKVNAGLFTKADMRSLTTIELNCEKATLITIHPRESYEFIQEDKVITFLKINNAEEFWKTSKYCVVETK
jgi:predicted RNase H-like nuclease (RuvC/YqgF family)